MKTRVWKVELILHDTPGYDDEDGTPIPYLSKKDLAHELNAIGPQCYGLSVAGMELKLIGHIEGPPTSRHPRKKYEPVLVPHKKRGLKPKKEAVSAESSGSVQLQSKPW